MASTYTLNNGIELIGTGEQSGTWGDTTNTNLELIDTALDGQVSLTLSSAGSSGSPNALPVSDGASSNGRNRLISYVDGGDLGATAYVQLTPNDAEKIIYIRNALSGSRSIIVFQGTYNASNDYEIPAGTTAVVYFNGGGTGAVAANVFNNAYFDGLRLGSVSVTAILDEDNMASNSATALSTQQSIKAYVDSQVGTVDTLAEILANGNTTGGTDLAVSTGDDITFADSSKAIFGAGSDLQIYHDGSHSIIKDAGAGYLKLGLSDQGTAIQNTAGTNLLVTDATDVSLRHNGSEKLATTSTGINVTGNATFADNGKAIFGAGSDLQIYHDGNHSYLKDAGTGDLYIQGEANVRITDGDGNKMFLGQNDGEVQLYYNGAEKLNTTSTGVDVTGTVTADGLSLGDYADALTIGDSNDLSLYHAGGSSTIKSDTGQLIIRTDAFRVLNNANSEQILHGDANGAVTLYYDNSAKIATTSTGINVTGADNSVTTKIENTTGANYLQITNGTANGYFGTTGSNTVSMMSIGTHPLTFGVDGGTERMRIDSSGSVGIGTSSPASVSKGLHVVHSNSEGSPSFTGAEVGIFQRNAISAQSSAISIVSGSSSESTVNFADKDDADVGQLNYTHSDNSMRFRVNAAERMRIDSSGNLLVGKTGASVSTAGAELRADGQISSTRSGDTPVFINRLTNDGKLIDFRKDGSTVGSIGTVNADIYIGNGDAGLHFNASGDQVLPINTGTQAYTNGFLDLGDPSARFKDLYLSGDVDTSGVFKGTNGTASAPTHSFLNDPDNGMFRPTTNTVGFSTGGSERMRIDSSGNLLVGTTDTTLYSATSGGGIYAVPNGSTTIARQSTGSTQPLLILNETGVDGTLQEFRKDGAVVGSIGVASGAKMSIIGTNNNLQIGANGSNIFNVSTASIYPETDNSVDLGLSNRRFQDLYLSGGVYLGGTGSANKLDDFETGTFTPSAGSNITINSVENATYTKVGRLITISIWLKVNITSANFVIGSLPFNAGNDRSTCSISDITNPQVISNQIAGLGIYGYGASTAGTSNDLFITASYPAT